VSSRAVSDEVKKAFGRRLKQLLDQKGMTGSDLARLVWGSTTTKKGYTVAKNRDRISVYIRGKAFPSPLILKKIAAKLGVEIADLAPEYVGDAMSNQANPAYSITKVQGEGDKVFLRVGHDAVAEPDLFKWAEWLETTDRHVRDSFQGDVRVSTVFLGLDHSFGHGPPLLFETMAFVGHEAAGQERYSTWEEAEAGHARWVAEVFKATPILTLPAKAD
jgi:transcriptional regulator with XRE-family HTH domain